MTPRVSQEGGSDFSTETASLADLFAGAFSVLALALGVFGGEGALSVKHTQVHVADIGADVTIECGTSPARRGKENLRRAPWFPGSHSRARLLNAEYPQEDAMLEGR